MLTIALCDDEAAQRSAIGILLQNYAASRPERTVKLSVFSSGWDLLSAVEETGGFSIYVLDVVMPGLSGIDLGVRLREMNHRGAIIYLTISSEFAVDSYAARAFHYLMKPVEPDTLFQVLDQAAAQLDQERAASITVKTKDGLRLARLDEILYAELSARTVRYHLSSGERLDSTTLRNSFQEEMAPCWRIPVFSPAGPALWPIYSMSPLWKKTASGWTAGSRSRWPGACPRWPANVGAATG